MTDDELAELEKQLIAKVNDSTRLAEEARKIAERIEAERVTRRRAPASVHQLRL